MMMDIEKKYRPTNLSEFAFPNDNVEMIVRAYERCDMNRPLILYGPHGTGKSLLGELIPKAIDGNDASPTKLASHELESQEVVMKKLGLANTYGTLFEPPDGMKYFSRITIDEAHFSPTIAKEVRRAMDEYRGSTLLIMTTNRIDTIDSGVQSRSELLEVPPASPERFLPQAKRIVTGEGFHVPDDHLLGVLRRAYELEHDNRAYYGAIEKLLLQVAQVREHGLQLSLPLAA